MTKIRPDQIVVLDLHPNDVIFVAAGAIDPDHMRGNFPVPIIFVNCYSGMSVAEHLAVVRKMGEEANVVSS